MLRYNTYTGMSTTMFKDGNLVLTPSNKSQHHELKLNTHLFQPSRQNNLTKSQLFFKVYKNVPIT